MVVGQFLDREQGEGFLVEEDRIIRDAGVVKRFGRLRPDFVVAFLVFGFAAVFELHLEGIALHCLILCLEWMFFRLLIRYAFGVSNSSSNRCPHCVSWRLYQIAYPDREPTAIIVHGV